MLIYSEGKYLSEQICAFPKEIISWEEIPKDPRVYTINNVTRKFPYISHLCDCL